MKPLRHESPRRLGTAIVAIVGLTLAAADAADLHLTVAGAGRRDGTSWGDALDRSALSALDGRLGPGDRLLVAGGTYPDAGLVFRAGGTAEAPVSVVGVDRGEGFPVLAGSWSVDRPTRGGTAIRLAGGVSHLTIENLRIEGAVVGVLADPTADGSPRAGLVFRDVDVRACRHGFYLSDCDDLTVEDCDLARYSKHGFRFDQGCDRVALRRCAADCSEGDRAWEAKTELFPFGFLVNDAGRPNTAIRFEDCLAANNRMPLQKTRYKNGDGFVVEGNAVDVAFNRCRALRNQDGGFDLKVADVSLSGCVAIGNGRGFRVWSTGTLEDCYAGFGTTGLWNNGGPLTARRCTFARLDHVAVMTDDAATAPLTLVECLIVGSPRPTGRSKPAGEIDLVASVVEPAAAPKSPGGAAASEEDHPPVPWDGRGTPPDGTTHPEVGYRAPAAGSPDR